MLLGGLKFDLRVYVLLTGVSPLRAFITKEGLARFATEKYESPAGANLTNMHMHLTNYAINKDSEEFVFNYDQNRDDVGHKRSIKAVFRQIEEKRQAQTRVDGVPRPSSLDIWNSIKDIVLKTLLSV